MRYPVLLAAALVLLALPVVAAARLQVAVSVPPQAHLVERIGGDRVDVSVMIGSGGSPHTFSLAPRDLQALDAARVYFRVGHPDLAFERRFLRHLEEHGQGVVTVSLAQDETFRPMDAPNYAHEDHGPDEAHGHDAGRHEQAENNGHADDDHEANHEHGAAGEHGGHGEHGETDPHVWVSPAVMRRAAARVADALIEADPEGEQAYRERLAAVEAAIDDLDARIRSLLGDLEQRRFVVNHPGWGYFADAYDLEQVAIESGGRDPSPRELARFIDRARSEDVQTVFVQQGFSERSARTIADALGARVVTADPLARDWEENLLAFAEALQEALQR